MKERTKINTFLILLIISVTIAVFNRYARMILTTYPLWELHLITFKMYMPTEAITDLRYSILVWATWRVILIDTLFNLTALYSAPYILRVFTKQFAILQTEKLLKFLKGEF